MFNAPGVPTLTVPAALCCRAAIRAHPISSWRRTWAWFTPEAQAKQSEHGGFAHDDTNVMLLVSNPGLREARTVTSFVETMQVAPTILKILGLDPESLDAVQMEGTPVLPGLFE